MRILNSTIVILTLLLTSNSWSQQKLTISYIPGKYYKNTHKIGLMKLNIIPQMAIWLEDTKGNFVSNIFITEKSAKNDWYGFNVRRPEALPIWSHKMGVKYSDGLYMPDKKHPLPDAVTGATSNDSAFNREWAIPENLEKGKYYIFSEVNNSFDYNSTYQEDLPKTSQYYNSVNGQPSILYKAEIEIGTIESNNKMEVIGHGEVLGRDGSINSDLSGVDEAVNILQSITVSVKKK
jgi:hypothetical protein